MSVTLESLSAQISALRDEIVAMRAAEPKVKSKAPKAEKKPKDPDAPKKETTWWIKATQHVREFLKPKIEEYNGELPEGAKKLPGTVPVQVSRILKEAGLLADGLMPSEAEMTKAFADFLENPPEVKTDEWKAAAAAKKAGSVSSDASSGSKKPKKPKAELSEEEATAARLAKAAKAKATREANKAKKAAEAAAPESAADMPFVVNGRAYLRVDNSLWDAATDVWVGEYNPVTKQIDTKAAEPERVYE